VFDLVPISDQAPTMDPSRDLAIIVDLLVGDGPICGQLRFDGVVVDADRRGLSVRYTPGPMVPTNPTVGPCSAVGRDATIVIRLRRELLAAGDVKARLQSLASGGWTSVAETTVTIGP